MIKLVKYLTTLFLMIGFTATTNANKTLLSFDITGDDATFQALPGFDPDTNFLCLWNGDDLKSFVATSYIKHSGDLESYFKVFKKDMKKNGAKSIKIEDRPSLKNSQKIEFQSRMLKFVSEGSKQKQIIYIAEVEDGVELAVVTLISMEDYDSIAKRTDKLILISTLNEI